MNLTEAVRGAAMRANSSPWPFVLGNIDSYDPATHLVIASYNVADANGNLVTIKTPPSQLMVPWWGQGYGEQSGPPVGAQCLVAIVDPKGDEFIVLGFTANNADPGLGAPSDEKWTVDRRGSSQKFTADGPTVGDGKGGLKDVAAAYRSIATVGGHQHILDDVNQLIKTQSAGGHAIIYDDVGKALSIVPIAGKPLGLGALASTLGATRAVPSQADLTTLSNNILSQSLQTMSAAIGLAAVTAAIPNAAAFHAILAAAGFITGLSGINPTIPGCSSIVRVVA